MMIMKMSLTLLAVLHGDEEGGSHPPRGLQVAVLIRHYGDDPLPPLVHHCCMLDVGVQSVGSHRLLRVS